jgi:hypothetical protein
MLPKDWSEIVEKDDADRLKSVADALEDFGEPTPPMPSSIEQAVDLIASKFDVLPVEVQMHMALHTWARHKEEAERLFHAFGNEELSEADTLKVKGYLALVIASMTYINLVLNAQIPAIDKEKRKALVTVSKLMDRKLFEQAVARPDDY